MTSGGPLHPKTFCDSVLHVFWGLRDSFLQDGRQSVGLGDLQRSLPTQTIVWFYDFHVLPQGNWSYVAHGMTLSSLM